MQKRDRNQTLEEAREMQEIEVQIENWKKRLLDLGKQNRLINYRETKRGNIKIVIPELDCLYDGLASGKSYVFPLTEEEIENKSETLLQTNKSITEQQHILKALRDKAKISLEEQGVNTLFLAMGLLKWKENKEDKQFLQSPIVLVPVELTTPSLTSPYRIELLEEEIVTNPTLSYKLEKEYGFQLPVFDENSNVLEYLIELNDKVRQYGWDIELECSLNLFSYSKMNMYQDLTANKEAIKSHPVLKAFGGDATEVKVLSQDFSNYNHDLNSRPTDTYQVLDADSSQQDAILYSKEGISFVLQGPPGTGKSQTITNVIAEALASNKKVLFVSEKMAALEVVYKRLLEVGLSEFCLPLHSHKANKKEVLEEINKTLHMDKVKLHEEVLYQLDTLQEHRKRLNQYAVELHTVCEPLHQSIYEINGRLSKLYLRPNVEFELADVEKKTGDELHHYSYLLTEYQKALEKFPTRLEEHPLYGAKIESSTHELRSEMEQKLEEIIPKIQTLSKTVTAVLEEYEMNVPVTLDGIISILQIFQVAVKAPEGYKQWLHEENIEKCIELAKEQLGYQKEFVQLKQTLDAAFNVEYLDLDVEEAITLLTESVKLVKGELNYSFFATNNEIVAAMTQLLQIIEQEKGLIQNGITLSKEITEKFGIEECKTLKEVADLVTLLELLSMKARPTSLWFDAPKWRSNYNKMQEVKNAYIQLNIFKNELLSEYSEEVLSIDYEEYLDRFEREYMGMYKLLRKEYRKDMEFFRNLCLDHHHRLDEEEIVDLLFKVKEYHDRVEWIQSKDEWLKRFLGIYYNREETNWDLVSGELNQFKEILDYYKGEKVPAKVMELLIQGEGSSEELKQAFFSLRGLTYSDNVVTLGNIFRFEEAVDLLPMEDVMKQIEKVYDALYVVSQIFGLMNIEEYSKMPYSEGLSILKKLNRYQNIEESMKEQQLVAKRHFASMYDGFNTDWNKILTCLGWIADMNCFRESKMIENAFLEQCMEQTNKDTMLDTAQYISWLLADLEDGFEWLKQIYPGRNLEQEKLFHLETSLDQIYNNGIVLDSWLEYRTARGLCVDAGLLGFIEEVEQSNINPSIITEVFMKRFYQLWIDKMVPRFPALFNFQGSVREDTRNDFDKLDVTQFAIAKTRIRERLLETIPDLDTSVSGEDEVSILKRELTKKHKRMPLRQLFESIPNLMLTLKPCFLMSPLSVSLFLKNDLYQFDLVIFDEASQIRTEDAIGAMLRGKQVIIAGDSEQLPPTNFFTAGTSSADNKGSATGESVLEEALSILPERTLRWHYRSRHESLIAFSNAKVYNHNLITFPSTVENLQNQGVEYYYVEDGIYDRGGKKCNVKEAETVARLIMEQASKRPNRSLGVITFSEAQQLEVEKQLMILRLERPDLEGFFAEDKVEPFFIKNLENVQGDERDTILFSIGYGKDVDGNFIMNFGPLSRSGGYRRLNVAITRAKYNIKLVGSILPEEIRVEDSSSEGVEMLQAYIQYAMNCNQGMAKEFSMIEEGVLSAPFEEAIYDYIVSHGYKVVTKVGCSGYRMDMAVVHPHREGHYVLGIECDGDTYHAARTARERERLRQTVLNDMGWKLYRIWSTDWIKNPFIAGQKLLEAIETAILEYQNEEMDGVDVIPSMEIEEVECSMEVSREVPVETPMEAHIEVPTETPMEKEEYLEDSEIDSILDELEMISFPKASVEEPKQVMDLSEAIKIAQEAAKEIEKCKV